MASRFRLSRRVLAASAAFMVAAFSAACGGGGGGGGSSGGAAPSPPASGSGAPIPRVFVAGDSLADAGTLGFKATVQKAADAAGYPVYPEIVAASLGAGDLCNHFSSANGTSFDSNAACTDFAVGGASVVNPIVRGGNRVPFSLEHQLETAVAARGGLWQPGDLLILGAGANDAAGLADTYLDARAGGADAAVYLALLGQQLSGSTIAGALAGSGGQEELARLYMEELARTWWSMVKANTLDRGATRVVLVDMPDLSLTPRFRNIAAGVALTDGPAAAAAFQGSLRQWIGGFNTELARLAAGEPRVVVALYSRDFTAQVANPSAYGLTNATDPSCPVAGDFPDCTDAALDASPPPGLAPGWWRTWFWSDSFHPSPRGHELLAATVNRALVQAGWR